ncbi:MAG: M15 family metallopeptidase [Lutibacter sp.]|uniref:M15 family metallopeptidase n=1 Tax=Lutibacter sp. TaxID=1925666 RepID=UPI00299D18B5|nr:M15 family metallopeptidase [Lutibacter sp.]MDX1830146.1 M15 family metallopeptidase [Lutibacter sp.]
MSLKGRYLIKILVLLIILNNNSINAQQQYSKEALTGKGGLKLAGYATKLQPEVFKQFKKMQKAALKSGIKIQIVSGYRSYQRQLKIWNKKYKKYILEGFSPKEAVHKIIEYSTIPGTSRHHWGTEIDVIDAKVKMPSKLLVEKNYSRNGVYSKLNNWMKNNAKKFGFYLVYTNSNNRKGFKYEPWHYSYKKLSKPMLHQFMKLSILQAVSNNSLKGNVFLTSDFVNNYVDKNVNGINFLLK